ncbi:MAG: hypothetical protein LBL66_08065 [Clostridiales bacterium]|nr:hypothetical protein [Clostridiales bacterium]
MNEEQTCQNCRYYSRHYSKQGTGYAPVQCGHCLHRNNKSMKPVFCKHWETAAVKKAEREKSIRETLKYMSKRLHDIALILKDDKE